MRSALALLLTIWLAPTGWADSLTDSCRAEPGTPLAERCVDYITGFLDGALITDTAIVDTISTEKGGWSAFFSRAHATRLASRPPPPATYLADFCLPGGSSTSDLAKLVQQTLGETTLDDDALSKYVYESVKILFPCETDAR